MSSRSIRSLNNVDPSLSPPLPLKILFKKNVFFWMASLGIHSNPHHQQGNPNFKLVEVEGSHHVHLNHPDKVSWRGRGVVWIAVVVVVRVEVGLELGLGLGFCLMLRLGWRFCLGRGVVGVGWSRVV